MNYGNVHGNAVKASPRQPLNSIGKCHSEPNPQFYIPHPFLSKISKIGLEILSSGADFQRVFAVANTD